VIQQASSKKSAQELKMISLNKKRHRFFRLITRNEEMDNIRRGKELWKLVRRKRRVIMMMAKMGEAVIFDLDKRRL